MLLVKLGILTVFGKKIYAPFLVANLIQHITQSIKNKIGKKLGEIS
jgi:hypothetical protein